jgi:16S rRNA G966 N2-methylase RsmD
MVEEMDLIQVQPVRSDAFKVIKNPWESYDLIFADPPFDLPGLETIPELILNSNLLINEGWLILEHPSKMKFNHVPELFDHRNYGSVNFSFFSAKKNA